jgi:acyl-CoA synthetase (AMP-forming)/AMP-acid ligase II
VANDQINWYPLVVGTFYAQATLTTANSAYNVTELVYQLKLSKAKAIVSEKKALSNAIAAAEQVGIPKSHIIVMEETTPQFRCWKDILVTDDKIKLEQNDPNSVALLCFSSGTTGLDILKSLSLGLPKAVMLSHRNIVAAVLQFKDIDGRYLSHHDVFCGVLPFYHIGYITLNSLIVAVLRLHYFFPL